MSGKIIVIEGLDGSGKATQTKLLCNALSENGRPYKHITFPDYESDSSALVKLYLNGAFGGDPGDVNAYAAASFYAVDRYASYKQHWQSEYESGSVILADRYVTSNLIYQLCKVADDSRDSFIEWLEDYEYDKLGLPRPAVTLYLDMEPSLSQKLLQKRYEGDESKKDIHEKNVAFLQECRRSALYSAERLGWKIIRCYDGETIKPMEEIHREIMAAVTPLLEA